LATDQTTAAAPGLPLVEAHAGIGTADREFATAESTEHDCLAVLADGGDRNVGGQAITEAPEPTSAEEELKAAAWSAKAAR